MNIDKYIDFHSIWKNEIILDPKDERFTEIINQFLNDNNLELLSCQCELVNGDEILFFFSESGGDNESDTQGWSRDYTFIFDKNFNLIDVEYSQG